MKVCIDPGHGMGNRRPGVFDPGATHEEGTPHAAGGELYREADIVLTYADTLRDVLALRGHETLLTRDSNQVECPVGKRAKLAQAWEADILVSLHMNDFDDDRANGIEVLFSSESSRVIANVVQASLVLVTGLANRGVKMRNDLAVLRFHGVAILIELGFIANDRDRTLLLTSETRWSICREIADRLIAWDRERHKGAA